MHLGVKLRLKVELSKEGVEGSPKERVRMRKFGTFGLIQQETVKALSLEHTLRERGRPKKKSAEKEE